MQIKSEFTLKASRQLAWEVLNDPRALQAAIPGGATLTEVGPDQYRAEVKVGIGFIRGRFGGTLKLVDKQEPEGYRMLLQGKGTGGWVKGMGTMTLTEAGPEETVASIDGDAEIGGMLGRMGQGMLGNASNSLIKQFFSNIQKEIAKRQRNA